MANVEAKYSAVQFDFASRILWLCLCAATHIVLKAPDYKHQAMNDAFYFQAVIAGPGGLAIAMHRVCTAIAGPGFTHVSEVESLDRLCYALCIIVLVGTAWKVYHVWMSAARAISLITEDMILNAYNEEVARDRRQTPHYHQVSAATRTSNAHSPTLITAQDCHLAISSLQPIERHQIASEDDCAVCLRRLLEIHDGDDEHHPDRVMQLPECSHTFCRHE